MAKHLGDKPEAHDVSIGLPDPNDNTAIGEALGLNASGNLEPFDAEVHGGVVGARPKGAKNGDNAPVVTHNVVIASVASGLTAGTEVGGGNATDGTTGQFASGGSRGVLLCDEGGTYKGGDIPAGAAAVDLR